MSRVSFGFLSCLIAVLISSCNSGQQPPPPENTGTVLPGANATLLQWVEWLQKCYDCGGISAFLQAKARLREQAKDLTQDEDYDIVALVLLRVDDDLKERELASRLRLLAEQIEQHPGMSQDVWHKFSAALLSYSFGNSPVRRGTAAERLVTLYAKIAGCEQEWREELSMTSLPVE